MKKITINFIKLPDWTIQSDMSLMEIVCALASWAYTILLRATSKIRSLEQNSWYWCICAFLAENTDYWWSKDDWHEFFSQNLLAEQRQWPWWMFLTKIESTTDLDTVEFTEYIEKILRFCELPVKDGWLSIPRKYLLPKLKGLEPPF